MTRRVLLFAALSACGTASHHSVSVSGPGPGPGPVSPVPDPDPGSAGSGSASAADAGLPGLPPSTQWPTLAAGYPDLPLTVEALLVRAVVLHAELLDTARTSVNAGDDYYILLVPGQRGRIVLLPSGYPLRGADARQLGIDSAAIVEVERDPKSPSCPPGNPYYLCARTVRRVDAGDRYALDAGTTLDKFIVAYDPTTSDGAALADRARAALDATSDPAGAKPARRPGYPLLERAFAVTWSPDGGGQLDILVVARTERVSSHHEVSTDPRAGSVGCEAPPGADCAPYCHPPGFTITSARIGEAGVRAAFDQTGARTSLTDAGTGVFPPRQLDSAEDDCN